MLQEEILACEAMAKEGLIQKEALRTSFALLLKEAMILIIRNAQEFIEAIKERAHEHKYTIMIGRSHKKVDEILSRCL